MLCQAINIFKIIVESNQDLADTDLLQIQQMITSMSVDDMTHIVERKLTKEQAKIKEENFLRSIIPTTKQQWLDDEKSKTFSWANRVYDSQLHDFRITQGIDFNWNRSEGDTKYVFWVKNQGLVCAYENGTRLRSLAQMKRKEEAKRVVDQDKINKIDIRIALYEDFNERLPKQQEEKKKHLKG